MPSSKLKFLLSSPRVSVIVPLVTSAFIAAIKLFAATSTSPGFASALKVVVMSSSVITTSATSMSSTAVSR